jgi:hypothetical protein
LFWAWVGLGVPFNGSVSAETAKNFGKILVKNLAEVGVENKLVKASCSSSFRAKNCDAPSHCFVLFVRKLRCESLETRSLLSSRRTSLPRRMARKRPSPTTHFRTSGSLGKSRGRSSRATATTPAPTGLGFIRLSFQPKDYRISF